MERIPPIIERTESSKAKDWMINHVTHQFSMNLFVYSNPNYDDACLLSGFSIILQSWSDYEMMETVDL